MRNVTIESEKVQKSGTEVVVFNISKVSTTTYYEN